MTALALMITTILCTRQICLDTFHLVLSWGGCDRGTHEEVNAVLYQSLWVCSFTCHRLWRTPTCPQG